MPVNSTFRAKALCRGLAAVAALLSLSACETLLSPLPPGVPPAGDIVKEIKSGDALPGPDKAVNLMARNLIFELVKESGKPVVRLEAANDDSGLGEELMKSLSGSKMLIDAAKADSAPVRYMLESRLDGARWTVKLLSADGRRMPRWGASIELDPSSLQGAK